ncbi:MAG TPA: hypothetical protein VGN78_15555 [Solirubrobacteraceae bacterium]|jgi:hypothetical protein|nr:hypothetical protein [Solirubrobacteraceae bacterium]
MLSIPLAVTHVLPDSGSFAGDVVAVVIAIATFAILYWAINLFDRV